MILYNVTLTLEHEIHEAWLDWMMNHHLAEVMATGMFIGYRVSKLLIPDNPDQVTYTAQYLCESQEKLDLYRTAFAPALQADGIRRFGDKMLAFRTVMEVVADSKA